MSTNPRDQQFITGTFYKYYFIGHGAQFRVYSVHKLDNSPTGRVIKVPLDFSETKRAIYEPLRHIATFNTEDELDELADLRTRDIMRYKYSMPNLIQGILGEDQQFMHRLGNMKILQKPIPAKTDDSHATYYLPIFFTQDYVGTLEHYFWHFRLAKIPYVRELDTQSINQLKYVIDQMISLHYTIWEYGIFEFVFKPENFGVRYHGNDSLELIWMDLAEHITDRKQAEAILAEQRWLHPLMQHKVDYQFLPTILHGYYADACTAAFTVENFRKHWRKKCIKAEQRHTSQLRIKEILSRSDKKAISFWVARHNAPTSLYTGFPEHRIDDMEIPPEDLQRLLEDTSASSRPLPSLPEERVERIMSIQSERSPFTPPLIRPQTNTKYTME
jgi:hypothetical protein